jgi:DNA-3-methyladenine glycosylase II
LGEGLSSISALEQAAGGPWSFSLAKEVLLSSSLATEYYPTESGVRRVLYLGEEPFVVNFSAPGDGVLEIKVFGDPSVRQMIEARVLGRRIFSLDHPVTRIYGVMSQDPRLRALCRKYNGLRIIETPSIFEMGATAIIGQQVNLRFTAKVERQMIGLWGKRVRLAGHEYVGFPTAESICRLPIRKLRSIQFSQRKAEYLVAFAEAIASGELDEELFYRLPDEEARQRLTRYRGIGDWTADMILMRALGRLDILPSLDTGLRTAYGLVFHRDRPTSEDLTTLASGWKGFRSYATFYLWASLPRKRTDP